MKTDNIRILFGENGFTITQTFHDLNEQKRPVKRTFIAEDAASVLHQIEGILEEEPDILDVL